MCKNKKRKENLEHERREETEREVEEELEREEEEELEREEEEELAREEEEEELRIKNISTHNFEDDVPLKRKDILKVQMVDTKVSNYVYRSYNSVIIIDESFKEKEKKEKKERQPSLM